MTLPVDLDSFLEAGAAGAIDWNGRGAQWMQSARSAAGSLASHEFRRSIPLLCQFISNRYYPHTQGDQRTIHVPSRHHSDAWITVNAFRPKWDWEDYARRWKPKKAERLFALTPEKLRHAYDTLASAQAHCDPLQNWHQLVQFVALAERKKLIGDALLAETLRAGAHMLRLLHRDLHGEELPHPNEAGRQIFTHVPELEVRKDKRRYLEFVANRYHLNPQPALALILEGHSEEVAVLKIFEEYFGAHPGTYGIEIVRLGGVDFATGGKTDRFRAILRLVDYLHHHQTFAFLILDNDGYARRLKDEARKQKSIHHNRRYITRPEYIRIWSSSFEFENFSATEIAAALNRTTMSSTRLTRNEVAACRKAKNPGAQLAQIYKSKVGRDPNKIKLTEILIDQMLSKGSRRSIESRPIIKTLERVEQLAARNYFPNMQSIWEKNQASKYLGKKRK